MANKVFKKIVKGVVYAFYKVAFRIKIEGIENIPNFEPCILAPNHISNFDAPLIYVMTKRDMNVMGKASIFKVPVLGSFLRYMGIYPVERNNKDMGAVKKSLTYLKQGNVLCIFPEGTRNKTDEELLRFRRGAVRIAKQSNTKIVPFAIKGEYKIFRKGLVIEFGKPVDVSNMEIEEANDYIRNEVLKMLRK